MAEGFPGPADMSASEIADMVQLSTLDKTPVLERPDQLYAAAWTAYRSAECKGNPEEMIEAEERLRSLRETYPGLE